MLVELRDGEGKKSIRAAPHFGRRWPIKTFRFFIGIRQMCIIFHRNLRQECGNGEVHGHSNPYHDFFQIFRMSHPSIRLRNSNHGMSALVFDQF